jgi:hypothetical protein
MKHIFILYLNELQSNQEPVDQEVMLLMNNYPNDVTEHILDLFSQSHAHIIILFLIRRTSSKSLIRRYLVSSKEGDNIICRSMMMQIH